MSESKYDLKKDAEFRELLMSERAALLARVDKIEQFLDMERTKDLRKAAKEARRDVADYAGLVGDES